MAIGIDKIQERQIRFLFGAVAFIGGITAILMWYHKRQLVDDEEDVLKLEKELKTLQVTEMKQKLASRK